MSSIQKNKENTSKKNPLKEYAWYSGIAFQMIFIILLGVFGGIKLDKYLSMKFPVFTVILTILAVAVSMYVIIKEVLKKK